MTLALGLALFLSAWLGGRGLNEPDEGRYANIALEFLDAKADWWEPHMSDFAHYDKPPLTYWLTSLSFLAFGQNETATRLPSLFGACLALVGVTWAAWRLHGARVAWWALLITGTLAQFWSLARFLSPDMLLTGFTSVAIGCWTEARHRDASLLWWLASLLAWSLAWWTKATAALVPLAGLVVAVLLTRDAAGLRALRPGRLLLGVLILGSPWYLRMMAQHPETVDFFLGRELTGRVIGHVDGRRGPVYYHAALLPALWWPWLPMLSLVAWRKRAELRVGGLPKWPHALGVSGLLVAVGVAIFSAISSKLPTYTLTLAPWAGLTLARVWVRLTPFLSQRAARGVVLSCVGGMVVLGTAAMVVMPHLEVRLGKNSSARPIAERLRALGADAIYADHYWPGMEFYFGEHSHYVIDRPPQQRPTDCGACAELHGLTHFAAPGNWRKTPPMAGETNAWAVRYARARSSPLDPPAEVHGAERVGDFLIWHIPNSQPP